MIPVVDHVWVIVYINTDHLKLLERDLKKSIMFRGLYPYFPTVKVLTKVVKGKQEFSKVPFLLNYGFIRIPLDKACSGEFLKTLKDNVSCIMGYVKNDNYTIVKDKFGFKRKIPLAIASDDEVTGVYTESLNTNIYSQEDLNKLNKGEVIQLKGYPFEGVMAEVLDINFSKKEVKVRIECYKSFKEVSVSFDNVFYSIYRDVDGDNPKERSLEDIEFMTQTPIETILMASGVYTKEEDI